MTPRQITEELSWLDVVEILDVIDAYAEVDAIVERHRQKKARQVKK